MVSTDSTCNSRRPDSSRRGELWCSSVLLRRACGANELLFREVNEQIEELSERVRRTDTFAIVCECSNRDCMAGVEVEPDPYRAVRSHPLRFLLSPGHEQLNVEHVVERTARYIVVEKIGIAAAAIRKHAA